MRIPPNQRQDFSPLGVSNVVHSSDSYVAITKVKRGKTTYLRVFKTLGYENSFDDITHLPDVGETVARTCIW